LVTREEAIRVEARRAEAAVSKEAERALREKRPPTHVTVPEKPGERVAVPIAEDREYAGEVEKWRKEEVGKVKEWEARELEKPIEPSISYEGLTREEESLLEQGYSIEEVEQRWRLAAEKEYVGEVVEWEKDKVMLSTGEWVPKEDFELLPLENQRKLRELGLERYGQWYEKSTVELDTGERISREALEELSPELQAQLKETGITEFNLWVEEQDRLRREFEAANIEIRPGDWISREKWDELTTEQQQEVVETGQYTIPGELISPEKQFETSLKEGTIPEGSTYVGPTEEGGFEYGVPEEGPPSPSSLDIVPASRALKEEYPGGVPTSIPEGFLSDKEYMALPTKDKLALLRQGKDIRAIYGTKTWEGAIQRVINAVGAEKPLEMAVTPVFYGLDPIFQDIKTRLETSQERDIERGSGLVSPETRVIQEEMETYMARWRRSGIEAAAVAVSIPALITPMPWIGAAATAAFRGIPLLPQIATALGTLIIRTAPTVYTASVIAEGSKTANLERNWSIFQTLPEGGKDFWAKEAGYAGWEGLGDTEKAHTLLRYSAPPGVTLSEWGGALGEVSEKAVAYVGKGVEWIRERAPAPIAEPIAFLGGTVVGAIVSVPAYTAMVPVLAASLVDKVPEMEHGEYASAVLAGMGAFLFTEFPKRFKADPALTSGWVVGMVLGPQGLLKLGQGLYARIHPKYVPERGMAIEWSVVKKTIKPRTAQAEMELVGAMRQAMIELLSGKKKVVFDTLGGRMKVEWTGTAYQKYSPYTLFSGTPDITKFDPANPGGMILWSSPQLARRFAELSASGVPMTHPGVIEVYIGPEGLKTWSSNIGQAESLAELERLAMEAYSKGIPPGAYPPFKVYKGMIEAEITTVGPFEAVPGPGGHGISANVVMGSYPIHRYILKGLGLEGYRGLSFKQAMQIRVSAGVDATLDFFLGWRGRMNALKKLVDLGKEVETPELRAFLGNRSALENIAEIIHGRRKALRIKEIDVPEEAGVGAQSDIVNSAIKEELQEMLGGDYSLFEDYIPYYESPAYTRNYISAYTKFLEVALGKAFPEEGRLGSEKPGMALGRFTPTREGLELIAPREGFLLPTSLGYDTLYERGKPLEALYKEVLERFEMRPLEYPSIRPPRYLSERLSEPPLIRPPGKVPIERLGLLRSERLPGLDIFRARLPLETFKRVPPPERFRYREPPPEDWPIFFLPGPGEGLGKKKRKWPPGTFTWRQGLFWKVVDPTQEKPLTFKNPPPGVRKLATGLGSAQKTAQFIGERVPITISVDLGVVDIFADAEKEQIRFEGGGLETDVGKRHPSKTKGMSVRRKKKIKKTPLEARRVG